MSPETNRVLMICYTFPPVGGAGVQRSVKFAKYLRECGWQPSILTVSNPSVPLQDSDLMHDVPDGITILRARTWEPGYGVKKELATQGHGAMRSLRSIVRNVASLVLQPDPQVLWNKQAMQLACRHWLSIQPHLLYVSGPPFSSFLLGVRLKKRFRIPLVVDFRDEWILSNLYLENRKRSPYAVRRNRRLFERVLRYADQIIATTQASATELEEHVRRIQRTTPVACIYNGFDPRDFEELLPPARVHGVSEEHPFDLVYTGTLWGLTNVEPLVQAVQLVNAQNPEIASMIRLQLVGRRTPEQEAHLETLESTSIRLVRTEYLPHRQSLALARRADMLLLLLSATAGAERVVPAKMFEYMACHRAILGILPPGEAKSILQACPNAMVLAPNDPRRIADFLVKRINEMRAPESADQSPKRPPMLASSPSLEESTSQGAWSDSWTAFDRRGQARQLANLLAACHKNRH